MAECAVPRDPKRYEMAHAECKAASCLRLKKSTLRAEESRVKLLLYTHYFAPSIGGVETIVMSLARGLAELRTADGAREFEITLATQTPRDQFDDERLSFPVVRQLSFWRLLQLVRRADVLHIAGPALFPIVLGLLARKPVVIEHHGFQVICPTGQMLIESRGEPCPGHFMAGHRGMLGLRSETGLVCIQKIMAAHVCAQISV